MNVMRVIPDQQRSALLESFRKDLEPGTPAAFRRAGQAAGVDWRTARRAWKVGWLGQKPLKDLIEQERHLARSALRQEELSARLDEASRLAQEDAVASRVDAGKGVRLATAAARAALSALHAAKVTEYLVTLAKAMQDEDVKAAATARKAYSEIVGIIREAIDASATGQRMEGAILGEPTVVLGGSIAVHPVAPQNVSTEDLVAEIEALQRAVDEQKALEESKKEAGNGSASLPQ